MRSSCSQSACGGVTGPSIVGKADDENICS